MLALERMLEAMPLAQHVLPLWLPGLQQAAAAYVGDNPTHLAMWMANIAHESRELTMLEEDLHYSAAGLLRTWPKRFDTISAARYAAAGPAAIASYVYANRLGNGDELTGDGWRYRARGPNGLTFRANYGQCSSDVCGDANVLLDNPELVMDPEFGAAAAGWVWSTQGCARYADANDFDGVCDCINIGHKTIAGGDSNGYASRVEYLRRFVLAAQ